MANTGTPLNLPLMSDSDRTPFSVYNAAMLILNGGARVDETLANEVAITGAATLSSTAYGKTHVITGTSADYTITLFTPATADLGKIIGFRVSTAGTKLYTLDAASTETIDGELTFRLSRNDVVYLKAIATSGNTWQIVGYRMGKASCRVFHNAAQSIANITLVPLAFNSERFDTDTLHDTVTNNTRLTCKTPGRYHVFANLAYAISAVGVIRAIHLQINGGNFIAAQYQPPIAGGALTTILGLSTIYDLIVGDYIECVAYQDSGGALNVNSTAAFTPEFGMVRVA